MRWLRLYQEASGRVPFSAWLDGLRDARIRGRIRRRIDRIAQGNFGDHKSVGQGVFERRLHFGPEYRVYYAEDGDTIVVLLCGGDKRTQARDIERAHAYWNDYQERLS